MFSSDTLQLADLSEECRVCAARLSARLGLDAPSRLLRSGTGSERSDSVVDIALAFDLTMLTFYQSVSLGRLVHLLKTRDFLASFRNFIKAPSRCLAGSS
jgi:hypothetical protein